MRLLLDTHVFIGVIDRDNARFGDIVGWLAAQRGAELHLSVASLWEMAIKLRLGKLRLPVALADLPGLAVGLDIQVLTIIPAHVLVPLAPEPTTHDPFDRLLLAQCEVENLQLVTIDRALIDHPLAARLR